MRKAKSSIPLFNCSFSYPLWITFGNLSSILVHLGNVFLELVNMYNDIRYAYQQILIHSTVFKITLKDIILLSLCVWADFQLHCSDFHTLCKKLRHGHYAYYRNVLFNSIDLKTTFRNLSHCHYAYKRLMDMNERHQEQGNVLQAIDFPL